MKIFLVIPTLGKGGAERVVSNLAKAFSALGHDVVIIIFSSPIAYNITGDLINLNILYSSSNKLKLAFNLIAISFYLRRLIKAHRPDAIFSFMTFANLCTAISTPNCCVSERIDLQHISFLLKSLSRVFYRRAKKVIAVSSSLKDNLIKSYALKNVDFIYNPIDLDLINHLKAKVCEIHCPFILSVGRLSFQKNHFLLIDAYLGLLEKGYECLPKLIILGEGELRKNLENYIVEREAGDCIKLLGNVDNPYCYMAQCKLFILSSLYEGFPNALIEAMACGAVCIATNCPTGPSEIIRHGENGFLVDNNDVKNLESMLFYCLSESVDYHGISKNAVAYVQKFSLKSIALQYLALCRP